MTQTELTSSTIDSLEAKLARDLSHVSSETIKDGAALSRSKSLSKKVTAKQRQRYSMMSQFLGNGDNDSEEQMFSADEEVLDTDHEDFQDASESFAGAARFLNDHRANGSVDLSAAHVFVRGADDMESVSSPFLATKFSKQDNLDHPTSSLPAPISHSPRSVMLEIGVQTESTDELVPSAESSIYNLSARDSMATFGGGSNFQIPDFSADSKVKINTRSLSQSTGARRTHAHQQSVTSPTESDDFAINRCSFNSIRTDTTSASEELTLACNPRRSLPNESHQPTPPDTSLNQASHPTDPANSSTSQKPPQPKLSLDQRRQITPLPSSSGFPPQRPCSPPPKELVEKAQIPRAIQLALPSNSSLRRSSYSSMPPPSTKHRNGKASPALQGKQKKAATLSRANKQFISADQRVDSPEMNQFGMALMAPVVHSSNEHVRRKMQLANVGTMGSSSEQLSQMSRRQSFNSDRTDHTSDPGDDQIPRLSGLSVSATTDPNAIHAITQTMIGEFLFKYTTKTLTRGFSEKRHRRFFWVHPYTKTLYWSNSDPGAHGANQSTAKSVLIESVRTIDDNNLAPSGLASYSLVIQTPNREMKITAPTKERHELWFSAINYLLTRPDPSATTSPSLTHPTIDSNPSTRGPDHSLDRILRKTDSKASRGPSDLPAPMKRGVVPSRGSAKQLAESPRFHQSSPAEPPVFENSFTQSAFGLTNDLDGRSASFNIIRRGDNRDDGEMADDTDVSMSYDSRCDDTHDDGFEGVENVRACCNGKHDIVSTSWPFISSRTQPDAPQSASLPRTSFKQREADRSSFVSNRALRPLDSPSLRASNLDALRSRYGRSSGVGQNGVSHSLQSSPAGTVSSRFHRESKFFQDLKSFNPASVEQLQTPPPRSTSRLLYTPK
ncbi:hypothetical protein Pst134EB_006287 [Puccinia striiformis f. sp. tritici]|nr:hypothetical protein Pst134EB_006287 [Puccinia striiformis f. sp. tritici]